MVDQDRFGKGASHGNCGFLSPSHALPLTVPGVVRKTVPLMFRKSSPFRVKLRWDPALWYWLFRFALRSRTEPMMEAARARNSLLQLSQELYEEIIREEALECEFERRGCLFVFKGERQMTDYEKVNQLLEEFGVAAVRYEGAELNVLEPALQDGMAGGWHHTADSHLRPDKLMNSLHTVLVRMGVKVYEQTRCEGFASQAGRAEAIHTSEGDLDADVFVLATGAWTPFLNRWLGTKIPIQPGKGYSITMTKPQKCPYHPLMFPECKVGVTPLQTSYRLGSTMEFAGFDTTLDPARLEAIKRAAGQYLQEPYGDRVEETWYGWRPMTYDGKPVIDRAPALKNVYIATGHNMLGISMAPATGKLIANLLVGEKPPIDLEPFSLKRF